MPRERQARVLGLHLSEQRPGLQVQQLALLPGPQPDLVALALIGQVLLRPRSQPYPPQVEAGGDDGRRHASQERSRQHQQRPGQAGDLRDPAREVQGVAHAMSNLAS